MRGTSYALSDKNSNPGTLDPETDYTFENTNYIYPNDPLICKKYKSFVTLLPINGEKLAEYHNKRLSQVNRCHFAIKLKQIKKEGDDNNQESHYHRYFLYYEAVPYSLAFVKANELALPLSHFRIEKTMKEIIDDLVDFNIFFEITVERCGFTEQGELRVYVPPMHILNERKLSSVQKQRMTASIDNVVKFWQMEQISLINNHSHGFSSYRPSYRFNSPQIKKESNNQATKLHRLSQENTDIKKTIKLSKNYIKEVNERPSLSKLQQMRKHKSMGLIIKGDDSQNRNNLIFNRIDELNKKISNIREALINKKASDHQRESIQTFLSREKDKEKIKKNIGNDRDEKYYDEEVIYEKGQQNEKQPINNVRYQDDDKESVDTYQQEIGHQYKMPKFTSNSQLRNTTLPTELQMIKNALQGKDKDSAKNSWYHESAGNVAFKKFIQNHRQLYNEIANQPRTPTSHSKLSAPGNSNRQSRDFKKQTSQHKLKKMVSLDNFQSHVKTKSINLSEFSNDLSNVKRRREKEQRNQHIKEKVQDILLKSKKAIELLKNPITNKTKK